jgi:hypothetical protein
MEYVSGLGAVWDICISIGGKRLLGATSFNCLFLCALKAEKVCSKF